MSFPQIDEAHHHLVANVATIAKPNASPVPISIVSLGETIEDQLIVFDGLKFPKSLIVARLRATADFLETQ